jgi:hypothetical protein
VRICKRCKQIFVPLRPYHRLCWACWQTEQAENEPDASTDATAWHAGYQAGYQQGVQDGRRAGELPAPIFKGLLNLIHPDRHSGTALERTAHELTVWLLQHRPDPSMVERN